MKYIRFLIRNKKTITGTLLVLFCLASAAICRAEAKSSLVTNIEAGKPQTVVTYGTSLTALPTAGAWVAHLQAAFDAKFPGKAKLINSGQSAMWSKWGVDHLDERVISKKPDAVFIEFAVNDAYLDYHTSLGVARHNLENMIDRILNANPDCEIVLMVMDPPTGDALAQRPRFMDYYQMYRDVAKMRHLLLIDHYPQWEKILTQNPDLFKKYVPDGIHPTAEGCANVITPEIVKALGL
jgi:lysophospholipase L1-like esterase